MGWSLYFIGIALIILAVFRGRNRSHSLKARDISSSVVINGDAHHDVTHSVQQAPQPDSTKPSPDRVAWAIGLVGVLVMMAQLGHDLVKP